MILAFVAFAEKNGVKKNEEQLQHSQAVIARQLKAIIARNMWGNSGFYPALHITDEAFQQALKQLEDKR